MKKTLPTCPICKSKEVVQTGVDAFSGENVYQCQMCGWEQVESYYNSKNEKYWVEAMTVFAGVVDQKDY